MLRFFDAANAVSLAGLCAALGAGLLAARGQLAFAVACLVGSGLCDVFDGFVARRLRRTAEEATFGQRLDSLVDACAFGVAPVFLLHAAGLRTPAELPLLALFAAAAVWRLAYFDTCGFAPAAGGAPGQGPGDEPGRARHYVGLPTTFVSLAIPLAFLTGLHGARTLRIAAAATTLGLAVAMVSPLRFPKPRGLAYPLLTALALGLLVGYLVLGARGGYPAA